jgi:hypothetical protein
MASRKECLHSKWHTGAAYTANGAAEFFAERPAGGCPIPASATLYGLTAGFSAMSSCRPPRKPAAGDRSHHLVQGLIPVPRNGTATMANSWVCVVEFGPKVRAWAVKVGGISGDPDSPHFKDQQALYAQGNLRPVYYYKAQLQVILKRSIIRENEGNSKHTLNTPMFGMMTISFIFFHYHSLIIISI